MHFSELVYATCNCLSVCMLHAFDLTSALYAFVGARVCCMSLIYCAACISLNMCVVMYACLDTDMLLALAWCCVCCQDVLVCAGVASFMHLVESETPPQ